MLATFERVLIEVGYRATGVQVVDSTLVSAPEIWADAAYRSRANKRGWWVKVGFPASITRSIGCKLVILKNVLETFCGADCWHDLLKGQT